MKACNALDFLVAKAIKIDIEAHENGCYLASGEPWNPSVNWAQCGPLINKYNIHLSEVCDRHEPHAAQQSGRHWVKTGETQQVAICNLVLAISKISDTDRDSCPYHKKTTNEIRKAEYDFKEKHPMLSVSDMAEIKKINDIGVEKYISEAVEFDSTVEANPGLEWMAGAESYARRLVMICLMRYPELIKVSAHESA